MRFKRLKPLFIASSVLSTSFLAASCQTKENKNDQISKTKEHLTTLIDKMNQTGLNPELVIKYNAELAKLNQEQDLDVLKIKIDKLYSDLVSEFLAGVSSTFDEIDGKLKISNDNLNEQKELNEQLSKEKEQILAELEQLKEVSKEATGGVVSRNFEPKKVIRELIIYAKELALRADKEKLGALKLEEEYLKAIAGMDNDLEGLSDYSDDRRDLGHLFFLLTTYINKVAIYSNATAASDLPPKDKQAYMDQMFKYYERNLDLLINNLQEKKQNTTDTNAIKNYEDSIASLNLIKSGLLQESEQAQNLAEQTQKFKLFNDTVWLTQIIHTNDYTKFNPFWGADSNLSILPIEIDGKINDEKILKTVLNITDPVRKKVSKFYKDNAKYFASVLNKDQNQEIINDLYDLKYIEYNYSLKTLTQINSFIEQIDNKYTNENQQKLVAKYNSQIETVTLMNQQIKEQITLKAQQLQQANAQEYGQLLSYINSQMSEIDQINTDALIGLFDKLLRLQFLNNEINNATNLYQFFAKAEIDVFSSEFDKLFKYNKVLTRFQKLYKSSQASVSLYEEYVSQAQNISNLLKLPEYNQNNSEKVLKDVQAKLAKDNFVQKINDLNQEYINENTNAILEWFVNNYDSVFGSIFNSDKSSLEKLNELSKVLNNESTVVIEVISSFVDNRTTTLKYSPLTAMEYVVNQSQRLLNDEKDKMQLNKVKYEEAKSYLPSIPSQEIYALLRDLLNAQYENISKNFINDTTADSVARDLLDENLKNKVSSHSVLRNINDYSQDIFNAPQRDKKAYVDKLKDLETEYAKALNNFFEDQNTKPQLLEAMKKYYEFLNTEINSDGELISIFKNEKYTKFRLSQYTQDSNNPKNNFGPFELIMLYSNIKAVQQTLAWLKEFSKQF
ncbi:hypothetical protein V2E24_03275 [Mycoplasmopsis ciconiae]|uniref:Lipoprotein n=1 Tax=Mycoplasmopsis ciconiae TaxID=561067 RepID=A0ABU7MMS3_9BACT|nr:hypothetical protein [Mycoplasmopsis ciconiae]